MPHPPRHILLIDDNAEDRADLRQMLLRGGTRRYRFSEALLGAEGVRHLLECPHGPVDCVLLDHDLPDMDAPEVLAALCQGAGLPPCPVVVVTGTTGDDGLRLLSAGAQDYIGKQWTSADSLTRAVDNAIERYAMMAEQRRAEVELVAAKAEAERASRAKSDFLLSMSHELRSPLSSMLGFAQLIEAGTPAPTAAQQDSVRQILRAGWYLLGLINEILDLSAIESGRMVVASQAMSLREVLDDCRAMIQPQAHGAGIALRFPSFESPCLVQADVTRTKQVLLNLLTNAIKYNRSGGSVDVRCANSPGSRVRVIVEDTGHGLSPLQLAQVFEPFNRLGRESNEESGTGTGIGLVICKRLVELMGGRIGVESVVGVGSRFWFELDTAAPARGLPVHTVLCVESDARRLLRVEEWVAGRPGVCLLRACDIVSGIEMARLARPDLILMGAAAPDASAVQALLVLAKEPATAHIPVIALGVDLEPVYDQAGPAAGFVDGLTHPPHSDPFERALDQAFQRTHASGRHAAAKETL